MPFSPALAERVRRAVSQVVGGGATGGVRGLAEKRMFGALCFMLDGNLLVGVMGTSLIARLGIDAAAAAIAEDYVAAFPPNGRPMRGWVTVDAEGIDSERQLRGWIERALRFVETLPAK